MIVLTQQERDKFADYLEQEARSDDGMAKQMELLPSTEQIAKHMRMSAASKMFVARGLRSIEEMTIGG